MLYYKKKFPYEEEFLSKLREDMDDLVENKLILTKKTGNSETNEISTNIDNQTIENTGSNDTYKNSNTISNQISGGKHNLFLITQIENFNHKIRANHIFTSTEDKFKKQNNDYNLTKKLLIKKKFFVNNNIQRINTITNYSTNINNLKNENVNMCLFKNNNKTKKIKHPYVSPLTTVKLNRYKMINDKDKFKENKKRYETNIINKYKERGLNQFGFPISYDITASKKYNYDKMKL